jgi:hypothetical protein
MISEKTRLVLRLLGPMVSPGGRVVVRFVLRVGPTSRKRAWVTEFEDSDRAERPK